ncbi:XRE family transcriptional regulator [Tamaricihabitans halophyticus]|uniref:XRE family transcriptional regulator n=1 Tax=Tamaricihabitans halophyticus TaxID=1262583 RepID=A0A4R2QCJ5_9PSEU|nr:XRE family transcriptional regulator [Tamaricihabitans halophyticus]TCP46319.1 XRE family transcriptional regulator [Tamaricihabitans halophyticus]
MREQSSSAPLEIIAAALHRERGRAGLSLSELAKRAGVAKSTLSQLESGQGNPSVETLWGLSAALGIPLSRLVELPTPQVQIIRAGEGPVLPAEHAQFTGTLLSAGQPNTRRDLYLATIEPGEPRLAEPHVAGSIEHVVLSSGRVRTGPSSAPIELNPGDYLNFPGDEPHIYQALEPNTVAVVMMEHR